jgi:hypothetical protein
VPQRHPDCCARRCCSSGASQQRRMAKVVVAALPLAWPWRRVVREGAGGDTARRAHAHSESYVTRSRRRGRVDGGSEHDCTCCWSSTSAFSGQQQPSLGLVTSRWCLAAYRRRGAARAKAQPRVGQARQRYGRRSTRGAQPRRNGRAAHFTLALAVPSRRLGASDDRGAGCPTRPTRWCA